MEMDAKDTVMSEEESWGVYQANGGRGVPPREQVNSVAKAQAEISFKAGMKHGIWLFAWWKDGVQYVGTSGRTLKEAYEELGIE